MRATAEAQKMYETVEAFLIIRGWQRIEPDEGWWWHPERESGVTIGQAFDEELQAQDIDTRIPGSIAASSSATREGDA